MATQLNVWLAQRTIIHLEGQLPLELRMWTDLNGSFANPIATYHPYNDILDIDMSDYLRTYRNVTKIYLSETNDPADYIEYNVSILGLIDPNGVYIPFHKLRAVGLRVAPPSKMYDSLNGMGLLRMSIYPKSGYTISGNVTYDSVTGELSAISGDFTIARFGVSQSYGITPLTCERDYAEVRWCSLDGTTRVHTWEMRKHTIASDGGYSLLDLRNEYRDIKGREDGLTISMVGLNAYDFWYYSDIITSPLVEVSLDGANWVKVQVTSKNVTIPDGDSFNGKLDITIKYKRYDAVDM